MNINVVIAIDNYINSLGMASIISEEILESNITQTSKEHVIQKINLKSYDLLVIDYQKKNPNDFQLITQIVKTNPKIKLLILTSRNLDSKTVRFSNKNNIGLILDSFSYTDIIKLLNFSILNYNKSRPPIRLTQKVKIQNITNLLSDRELEIALLLIKGETITAISQKKKLAITTISTYKKRIFEKTKVKNLIEMVELFNRLKIKVESK